MSQSAASDDAEQKQKELRAKIGELAVQLRERHEAAAREERTRRVKEEFRDLVGEVTELGRKLNGYELKPALREPHFRGSLGKSSAHLFFCGYLEGDFSERSYLPLPIVLSGGFFMKTAFGNFLIDPGMGTLTGMRDLGVDVRDTHCIVASHYHPSARFDLHTLLNELGGYCPGRFDEPHSGTQPPPRVHLFSSSAVIEGRNGHPKALIPSDEKVTKRWKAAPGTAWTIKLDANGGVAVNPSRPFPAELPEDALLLHTFPAYHSEAVAEGELGDPDGVEGRAVSCYLFATSRYGILFTGDTEFPIWDEDTWNFLENRVIVLVANMKTIEYRPKQAQSEAWPRLRHTRNQLGFEGTRRLAERLKPKLLVIRALGLECVVQESMDEMEKKILRYAPERLGAYRNAMKLALEEVSSAATEVIIPGRHEIRLDMDHEAQVKHHAVVPAFIRDDVYEIGTNENVFRTTNSALYGAIQSAIDDLVQEKNAKRRPFVVIQGESGGGKTQLAKAMAEVVADKLDGALKMRVEALTSRLDAVGYLEAKMRDRNSQLKGGDRERITAETRAIHSAKEALEGYEKAQNAARRETESKVREHLLGVQGGKELIVEISRMLRQPISGMEGDGRGRVDQYDLATMAGHSDLDANLLFGWPKDMYFAGDEGYPGLLSKKNGVLILNQLEKLPIGMSQTFLDVVEEWKYRPRRSKEAKDVGVRILFTTNIDLASLDNLTADLKNRLGPKCLTIPPLHGLEPGPRRREIDLFVADWCGDTRSPAVLAGDAWDALHEVDLSNGEYRCLRELLNRARSLAKREYALDNVPADKMPHVLIERRFVEQAMMLNGVKFLSAAQKAGGAIPQVLVLVMAAWLSTGCNDRLVYRRLREIKWGQSAHGVGSSDSFKRNCLRAFLEHFDRRHPEGAFEFFYKNETALAALRNRSAAGLVNYAQVLAGSDDPLVPSESLTLHASNAGARAGQDLDEWLEECRAKLTEGLRPVNLETLEKTFLAKVKNLWPS